MTPSDTNEVVLNERKERRRERSRKAAKCRRQQETDVFNEICECIPIPQKLLAQMDKSTIIRLLISFMKLRKMLNGVSSMHFGIGSEVGALPRDEEYVNALNGFILILSHDCDVLYVSNNVKEHIGMTSLDMIGQNLFDYTHEGDHREITRCMNMAPKSQAESKSLFLRMKSTLMSSGRNVNIKSANYVVLKLEGILHHASDQSDSFMVAHCEPIPHPSNIDLVLDEKTFLSQHNLDMKFIYCDKKRVNDLMGYSNEDMVDKSFYEFCHTSDLRQIEESMQKLFRLGQITTGSYRMLAKCGGYVWVITQATVINNPRNHQPSHIVCINYVISEVVQPQAILSLSQMTSFESSFTSLIKDEDGDALMHNTNEIFYNITDLLFNDMELDSALNFTDDILVDDQKPSSERTENMAQNAPSIGDQVDFSRLKFAETFNQNQTGVKNTKNALRASSNEESTTLGDGESRGVTNRMKMTETKNIFKQTCRSQEKEFTTPACSDAQLISKFQLVSVPESHFEKNQQCDHSTRKRSFTEAFKDRPMDRTKYGEQTVPCKKRSAPRNLHDTAKLQLKKNIISEDKEDEFADFWNSTDELFSQYKENINKPISNNQPSQLTGENSGTLNDNDFMSMDWSVLTSAL